MTFFFRRTAFLLFVLVAFPAKAVFHLFPPASPCNDKLELLRARLKHKIELLMITPRLYISAPQNKRHQLISRATGEVLGHFDLYLEGKSVRVVPKLKERDDVRRQGYMTEAKYAALKYAFTELGATSSMAYVRDARIASRALHLKLGYKEPKGRYVDGDILPYTLSGEDFSKIDQAFQAAGPGWQQFLPTGRWRVVEREIRIPYWHEVREFERELQDELNKTRGRNEADSTVYRELFDPKSEFQFAQRGENFAEMESRLLELENWGGETDPVRFAVRKRIREIRARWQKAKLAETETRRDLVSTPE